jgi:perosamine synthetase
MGLGYELIPVDADILSWNMDLDYCKDIGSNTALLAVHNLGNIINIPVLQKKYPDLVIVEDACEGLFGTHNHSAAGTKSLASAISFFGNKTITSGEGGAFLTNDGDLYHHAFKLTEQGQTYHTRYLHDRLGYNYRMTNVQAAILYGQLKAMDDICSRKEVIFERYRTAFDDTHLVYQNPEKGTCHANWMFGLRFPGKDATNISTFLRKKGIDTRPMFFPFSKHDHFKVMSKPDQEEVANTLHKEVIILPSFPDLTKKEVNYIIETIQEGVCQL